MSNKATTDKKLLMANHVTWHVQVVEVDGDRTNNQQVEVVGVTTTTKNNQQLTTNIKMHIVRHKPLPMAFFRRDVAHAATSNVAGRRANRYHLSTQHSACQGTFAG